MQLSLEKEKEVMPLAVQLLQLAVLQVRAEADRLPVQVQHQLALPAVNTSLLKTSQSSHCTACRSALLSILSILIHNVGGKASHDLVTNWCKTETIHILPGK